MKNILTNELTMYKKIIDEAIDSGLTHVLTAGNDFPSFMDKYISAFQSFCAGGKRIRAYLVKLGYEMCTGSYDERIILPSLSYEIFQTGVLIHDDIIDRSDTRRNMPSMHVALGNDHAAVSKAICIGDVGLFGAIDMILYSDFEPALIKKAIAHQTKIFELTLAGELKDIELADCPAYTLEDITEMYELKTSGYTIAGPLQLGAILGNASQNMLLVLEKIGMDMGVAFQIKDDMLGIFGKEDVIGKSNLSDMQEGKKTVLTRHFLDTANDTQLRKFSEIYGKSGSGETDLLTLQILFRETKTYEYAEELCRQYSSKCEATIAAMDTDDKYKEILFDFLNYLCGREM